MLLYNKIPAIEGFFFIFNIAANDDNIIVDGNRAEMVSPKFHDIFTALLVFVIITQFYLIHVAAVNQHSSRMEGTLSEEDFLHQGHLNFVKHYAQRSINVSRAILRDNAVVNHPGEEVEKFKKNLSNLIIAYEAIKNPDDYSQIVEDFGKLADFYIEMPLEKRTTDTQFIVNILKKYEGDKITAEVKEKMSEFMARFMEALMVSDHLKLLNRMYNVQVSFKLGCVIAAAVLLQSCNADQLKIPQGFDQNISQYYAQRSSTVARNILRDTSVITNHNAEVEKFKQHLMAIVRDYYELKRSALQNQTSEEAFKAITERFYNVSKQYMEPTEGRTTKDNKFIMDILKKYGGYQIIHGNK
ncbi:hypothetical protein DOY81_000502 [Sarcophaga bullata]|nr:hypothetical protein DOY81_000502 [Sarcophaga bullata]